MTDPQKPFQPCKTLRPMLEWLNMTIGGTAAAELRREHDVVLRRIIRNVLRWRREARKCSNDEHRATRRRDVSRLNQFV